MNKERRKRIAQAHELVTQAMAILEEVREQEEEALSNLPDSLQEGEKGQAMQEHVDNLQQVHDDLENVDFDQFGGDG